MLLLNPEFVENSDYGFAVARVRALENRLITGSTFNQLINSSEERFLPFMEELSGIGIKDGDNLKDILEKLEWKLTENLFLVKNLLIEDEYKRLLSLKYDYELLKLIIKEKKNAKSKNYKHLSMRSNYTYPVLKSLIESGSFIDLGPQIADAYKKSIEIKDVTGKEIDRICDISYFDEVFNLLDKKPNDFIKGFFKRQIDAINLVSTLRLKALGGKRSDIQKSFIPSGSVDFEHFEEAFELNMDSMASRLNFTWFSAIMQSVPKSESSNTGSSLSIALIERLLDEAIMDYLRESIYVTFGVEPVISYFYRFEIQTKNLRLITLSKFSDINAEDVRRNVRGINE